MKQPSVQESGSTLAVVITTMAILIVVVGIAIDYTTNETRNVQRSVTFQSALAIGDSAIDVLFNSWRTTCRTAPATVFKTSDFSAAATPSPFPNLSGTNFVKRGTGYDPTADNDYDSSYTISNYKIIAVSAEYTALASTAATPEPALGQLNAATSSVSPTTAATWNYVASADVTLPVSFGSASRGYVTAKVRRIFSKQQLSPWNWAIFYVDPLEIHPGPSFTVTGWVHTNSDLYTGHSSLTFADKVTYASDWFESTTQSLGAGFMPGDTYHSSTDPANGSPTYPSKLPPARDQALQPFGLDSTSIFSSTDSNPNNDSYRELIDLPDRAFNAASSYTDPLASARYWNQALVAIQVSDNPSSSTAGWDGVAGHDVVKLYVTDPNTGAATQITSNNPSGSTKAAYDDLYNMFHTSGVITTNQNIQDNREGATVTLASLDISKIETGAGANPSYAHPASGFSSNPIIYIYDASATASKRRGIRIKNAAKIPTNGLTIASNNPVYIQGDFNSGGNGTNNSNVPSNNSANLNSDGTYPDPSNPPNPQVSGYTRAPCSILADAVNILSNSWLDANSSSTPAASSTTINVALVAGIVPTNTYGDGGYSGGAENFPRFLEDWTNKTLTYYGSMVELFKSQQAVGEWGTGYSPPTREWFFDNNFRINPPPGTLMLISYSKGLWSLQ